MADGAVCLAAGGITEYFRRSQVNPLATKLARAIFEIGDEPSILGGKVQRIQFMGGTYPDAERPLGGLCESSLEAFLDYTLAKEFPSTSNSKQGD